MKFRFAIAAVLWLPVSGVAWGQATTKPAGFQAYEVASERGLHATEYTADAKPIAPLFDEPLTDISIARHAGDWFLTGSPVRDGNAVASGLVTIWHSPDGREWKVARELKLEPRRVLSPELHFADNAAWLTIGLQGGGTALVKFASADVRQSEWTYAQITRDGGDPSLFRDDDGSLWWVTGGGQIARLKDNPLEGLAGEPKQITVHRPESKHFNDPSLVVGTHGAHLAKIGGQYCLFAADRITRNGLGRLGLPGGTHDTFVASASHILGPYSRRMLAFPHAGQVTLFRDGERWWSSYSGGDARAVLRFRPAMFPVDVIARENDAPLIRPASGIVFEAGPVARLLPGQLDQAPGAKAVSVRDPFVARLPDGTYRLTGTASPDGVAMWASDDLKRWKLVGRVWQYPDDPTAWFNSTTNRTLWAPELHRVGDDYYIPFSAGNVLSNGLLRSTTGKPEGPYELTRKDGPLAKWIDSTLFVDTDGKRYLVWQSGSIAELNADMSGFVGPTKSLRTIDGEKVGHEGVQLLRIGDWYVLTAVEWNGDLRVHGTYDMMYGVSKSLFGPYSKPRLAVPHGGHGTLFRDRNDRWHASLFGNDRTAPFRKMPGVIPLTVQATETDLIIYPTDGESK